MTTQKVRCRHEGCTNYVCPSALKQRKKQCKYHERLRTPYRACCVPGCSKKTNREKACSMHTHRKRNYGSYGPSESTMRKRGEGSFSSDSGWSFYDPKHKLAAKNGRVQTARSILYARYPRAKCNFCGHRLGWFSGPKVHVLYRDDDNTNCVESNLVMACGACKNTARLGKHGSEFLLIAAVLTNSTVSSKILDEADKCSIKICSNVRKSNSAYCYTHVGRFTKHKNYYEQIPVGSAFALDKVEEMKARQTTPCEVEGCSADRIKNGSTYYKFCNGHQKRWVKYKDTFPSVPLRKKRKLLQDAIKQKLNEKEGSV